VKNCSLAPHKCSLPCHSHNNRENLKLQVWGSATSTLWSRTYTMWLQAFDRLTETLCGCQFGSDCEVNEMVHKSIREQPKTFFSDWIRKLVDCWQKCMELQGDYVEKQ